MELTAWIDTLLIEVPKLWQCLKNNAYPDSFLTNALGLSPEACARLPRILIGFLTVYLLCGAVSVVLRFRMRQKSLNSVVHQINTAILVCCSTLFVPLLVLLAKACVYVLKHEVAPLQGKGDYIRFFGEAVSGVFYIALAFVGVFFTVWMPVSSFLRYWKVYRLRGLPHGVFDVGFGLCLISAALLACYYGDRRLYALLLPAVTGLALIQTGGCIPEERNIPGAMPPETDPAAEAAASREERAESGSGSAK